MSDFASDLSSEDQRCRRRPLPTEELAVAGNPNPLGVPFFRNLPVLGLDQDERASLLGSEQYVFQSSGSDTYSGDCMDEVRRAVDTRMPSFPGSSPFINHRYFIISLTYHSVTSISFLTLSKPHS